MLIRRAEINFSAIVDIRVADGIVVEIGQQLVPQTDEAIIDARSRALIPGLHDHHIHFLASAAARESLFCGPPQIADENALRQALQQHAANLPSGKWLRGIGYHASVAGDIDRHWIDRVVADVPVRIQHRSGRLWILNSCALEQLGDLDESPLEKINGAYSGRLYDADVWLRERIGRQLPDIAAASLQLTRYGVTGFTDTSVSNTAESFTQFAQWQANGELSQHVVMMGDSTLVDWVNSSRLQRGALKMHLHENDLPEFEAMCAAIAASHTAARPVAVHCVTLVELVFTLNAFAETGTIAGDRIEHAAIAPPEMLEQLSALKLIVVTQSNFIAERGDAYLRDVDPQDQPWLYRLRGFLKAGIALAGGTDAPFGDWNPWAAMQAAVTRRTASGAAIGIDEALTPEQALELFLGDPLLPGAGKNRIEVGMPATLCLLDRSWQQARHDLARVA
ncbi:MAG TPA: amidohydrolase family protein, partial [Spongiibacteraceae bacterium]|nr:amidohydrolase family protein [Spongiibacteraceae bacterium]